MKSGEKPSHYSANSRGISLVKHSDARGLCRAGRSLVYRVARFCRVLPIPARFCKVGVMKIVIAGGSGFLGSPLAEMYAEDGHDVRVLTRSLESGETRHDPGTGVPGITQVGWKPDGASGPWATALEGADGVDQPVRRVAGVEAVVAGDEEAIEREPHPGDAQSRGSHPRRRGAAGRPRQRQRRRVLRAVRRPAAHRERSARQRFPGASCASTGRQEARQAERPGTRVVLLRTGIVLERSGGALPEMMRPFKFFAGGPLGSGRQYVSWVHRLDWIEIVRWIVQTPVVERPCERHGAAPRHQPPARRARSATRCIAPASCRRLASR